MKKEVATGSAQDESSYRHFRQKTKIINWFHIWQYNVIFVANDGYLTSNVTLNLKEVVRIKYKLIRTIFEFF